MIAAFNDTYEIRSTIGRGGMSTVYLAEHKRLHTNWAVKEVRKKQQGDRFDFLAESNLLKRLQHPMLPRIVDIFEDADSIYIVEDFVEGITLEELLKRQKRVDEAQALQWFRDLCGVLSYLHTQQPPIIYRDMKPSNVMLQPSGTLKLIDFGIAREYKQDSGSDTAYIGTKGYAAPEQFGSAQTDARTDIYALGVTMYHLVTGKSPYEPPYQFVPARQLSKDLSHGMEYILNKCVQPEPEARYQSIDELLYDLEHIYRFDKGWKRVQRIKRVRAAVIVVMLLASGGLMYAGYQTMGQEKEAAYTDFLSRAAELSLSDYSGAAAALEQARELFPDRPDADRQQTYALYLSGNWRECVSYGAQTLERYGPDAQTRTVMAAAQFELGDYEAAEEGFAQDTALSQNDLRDYAVCLGRLGKIDQAERVLEDLIAEGSPSDVTLYVQGEVSYAKKDYLAAESAFLRALDQAESPALTRRCYVSLGGVYRDCAALVRTGGSPIENPASRSAQLLSSAVVLEGLRYDSVLWEMLGQAYYEAYSEDPAAHADYLDRAAECFSQVIEFGVNKEYLYTNLYSIYYEQGKFDAAKDALDAYETAYPDHYMPYALRGIMLIAMENQKPREQRDFTAALEAYETAGSMIRSSDDTTYYQQLGSLVESLRQNGWL